MEETNNTPYGVKMEISTNAKGSAQLTVKAVFATEEETKTNLSKALADCLNIIKEKGLKLAGEEK